MKDRFFVIQNGREVEVDSYLKDADPSSLFNRFIEREALGISVQRGSELESNKPKYLSIANRYGFAWEKNSVLGFVNYSYKAELMMELVKKYSERLVNELEIPIYKIRGANGFDESHEVVQAYADLFGDRMLKILQSKRSLVMGYDASYPQFNLASEQMVSEAKLPYAHYSISDCYRNEQRGECMMLYRQRRFFMPDLHPYFKDLEQVFEYIPLMQKKILDAGIDNGLEYHLLIEVNGEDSWLAYREEVLSFVEDYGSDCLVQVINDGKPRYWILNMDYKIMDQMGQAREIGCIQIDVDNSRRLGIEFIKPGGSKDHPIIVHSAIPGGIERFIYALVDRCAGGEHLPLWLRPIQCRLVPVSEKYNQFCLDLASSHRHRVRIDVDDRDEVVGRKIKSAKEEFISDVFVVGEKEVHGGGNYKSIMQLISKARQSSEKFPFIELSWPMEVSRRI